MGSMIGLKIAHADAGDVVSWVRYAVDEQLIAANWRSAAKVVLVIHDEQASWHEPGHECGFVDERFD